MVDHKLACAGEAAWQATPLDRPLPELYRSINSAARRNIAAADRKGVTVEAATGLDAVRCYHRLAYRDAEEQISLLAQPVLSLFRSRSGRKFSAADGIVTVLARLDGEANREARST